MRCIMRVTIKMILSPVFYCLVFLLLSRTAIWGYGSLLLCCRSRPMLRYPQCIPRTGRILKRTPTNVVNRTHISSKATPSLRPRPLTRKHYRGMHHGTTARISPSPEDLHYKGPVGRTAPGIKFIRKNDRQDSFPSRSHDKLGLTSLTDAAAVSTRSRKPGMEICTVIIVPGVLLRSW